MSSVQVKRIVWRLAKPIDICLAVNGGRTLSQERINDFKRQFGHQIEKNRPWGMVINDDNSLKARLYSRTTSAEANGKDKLSHDMHDSFECSIDEDGVVELTKYVEMPRNFWESKLPKKKSFNGAVFTLMCFCEKPSCRRVDVELLKTIDKLRQTMHDRRAISEQRGN